LQLTYLALARVGPIRTRVEVLDARPGVVVARVELIDSGSDDRVTTIGRVVATTSLRAGQPGADPEPRTADHGLPGRSRGGGRSRMDISTAEEALRGFPNRETGRDVSRYIRVELHEVEGVPGETAPRVVGHAPASDYLRGP